MRKVRLTKNGVTILVTQASQKEPPTIAIMNALKELNTELTEGEYLIEVQLGTAWVYYLTMTARELTDEA